MTLFKNYRESIIIKDHVKAKHGVLIECTLSDMTKPIGLAEYRLEDVLPENLKTLLPTIEELKAELAKNLREDI